MEGSTESCDNGTTNWNILRAFGNVTERIGSDLIVECTSKTYIINVNLIKREASQAASDASPSFLSQPLVLHVLKYETMDRVVYGQFRSQIDERISAEIDERIIDFMDAIESLEPDLGKNLFNKFFASLPHKLTLQGTLSLVKDSLTSLKLQQLECDLESSSLANGFQEKNVFLIDEDSGSECSINEFNIEEPDPGMLLLGSDSKSPTIDLAEEDEHRAFTGSTAETTDENGQNQQQTEPSINFQTLALGKEKKFYPSLQSTLLEWLTQHYYQPIYTTPCAEKIAWEVIHAMNKLSIDIDKLYESFGNVINQGLSLDHFSSSLLNLKGFSDSEDKLLIADFLDPVLAFLVASLLPNKVLTRGLQNVMKGIKVESCWTRNVGIISDTFSNVGLIVSDVGYVFFDKQMLKPCAPKKLFRRNLVFFNAMKFTYKDLTWGVASKVCRFYEAPLDCETTEKLLKPPVRPVMDIKALKKHSAFLRDQPQIAYENVVIEEFSRHIFNRKSIDLLIIDSNVSTSLEGLQYYFASSFGGPVFSASAPIKSNLYAAIWARLGFTETHLSIDYHFLYSFGGESCVFNSWLSLLYLVQLPRSVNPLELIRLTIAYFKSEEKPTCMNYLLDFEKFNYNRAIVENLVDELLGHRFSRNPIVLEPFKSPSDYHSASTESCYNETLLRQSMQQVTPFRQSLAASTSCSRFQYPNPPFSGNLGLLPPPSYNGMDVNLPLQFAVATSQRPFAQSPLPFITSRRPMRPPTSMVFPPPVDGYLFQPAVRANNNYGTIVVRSEMSVGKIRVLPIDSSGKISSSTLAAYIPGASSILYKLGEGPLKLVKKYGDNFVAPPGGWERYSYLVS